MANPQSQKLHASFGFADFLWRWAGSIVLVLATYNPTGHSYFHWVSNSHAGAGIGAPHVFVGCLLLVGWTVFVVATQRSLGALGTVLGIALIGSAIWYLADLGVIHAESRTAITWLALLALATLLAVGLSWSHIWRRLSGQLEVDDTDD